MSKFIFLSEIVLLTMKKHIKINGIVTVSLLLGLLAPFIAFANINVFLQDMNSLTPRILENVYYNNIITGYITQDEYIKIEEHPEIRKVGGYNYYYCNVEIGGESRGRFTHGISHNFLDFINFKLLDGRLPTDQELRNGSNVCLVEESFYIQQMKNRGLIETITIDGEPMQIIGIFKSMEFKGGILFPSSFFDPRDTLQEFQQIFYIQYEDQEQIGELHNYISKDLVYLENTMTLDYYFHKKKQLCINNSLVIFLIALPLVIFAVFNSLLVIYGKFIKTKKSMGIKIALGSGRKEIFLSNLAENIFLGIIAYMADILLLNVIVPRVPSGILLEFGLPVYLATFLLLFIICIIMSLLATRKMIAINISTILKGE